MDDLSQHYSIEFQALPEYLKVTVHADVWTPEIADHYNRRLAARMSEIKATRVLIVRDIPVTLRLVAVFTLMSDFVDGIGRRKVAVVNPFPELREDLKFTIQVATNRGARYKLFDTIGEAEEWLCE